MKENELSNIIIGCAIDVQGQLDPGLLESAYQECLLFELKTKNLSALKEKPMLSVSKDIQLNHGYKIDLLVENKGAIEIKSVIMFTEVHSAQVPIHLKLGNYKLGLLLNFYVPVLKNGIKKIVNSV